MPQQLDYSQKYLILSGRVKFADYVQRQESINQGNLIGLNIYKPNNDASIVPFIQEAQVYTTPDELSNYLAQVARPSSATNYTVPDAPLSLCVIPSDSALTILFITGSTGGTAITNYQYSTDGVTFTPLSPAQTSSPVTINGLTNGTVYTIYLKAVNSVGASVASSPVIATPIPSSFNPASISGLNIWLDGLAIDNVILSSGQVSAWNDSSSQANNFTASGTGVITYDKPSNINSRPALNFTTANPITTNLSKSSFNISPGTNQLTLFMIVNQTARGIGNSELFFTINDYRYFDLFNNTNSTGNLSLNVGSAVQRDTGLNIITTPSTIAIISVVISTTGTVYLNGTVTSVNGALRGALSLDTQLTWAISGGAFKGNIGEVITYPSALTDSDRQKIEGYLAWKWGLQANLPDSNPWKTAPPTDGTAPGTPTLQYILIGNNSAYVYYSAGTGTTTNYQYTTNSGTSYTSFNPVDIISPTLISGLTNGSATTIQLRAYNTAGFSSISNGISVTPNNPSVPSEWLLFDPNNSSSYSGSGTTVSNIGSFGALSGTITGSVSYITGTNTTRKVFNFTGGYIAFGSFNFGSSFTISAWIYPVAKVSINAILANGFANVNTAGFKFGWNSWSTSDRNILFENGDGTVGNWTVPSSVSNTITNNTWQHVTVIFNQATNTAVFLLNGIPVNVNSITTANTISVNRPNFNIGSYLGGLYSMNAQLGLLKVFNSSLTSGQVLADFNATRADFGV